MQPTMTRGAATGCDLTNLTPLLRMRRLDQWGMLRPDPNEGFLRLSAELASTAYDMEVTPWLQAGWRDVTVQVDGDLTGGMQPVEQTQEKPLHGLGKLFNALKMMRVKQQLQKPGPISQMLGAVRQMKTSSTCKAVVMLHPTQDGRYVVAIGFTGTKHMNDWFSNFRMTADNGFHRGFLQLCRQFENNEEAITFPETAAELGLDKLTLGQILYECRHPESRFLLWIAGHSQGAAVMQAWAHMKLTEEGVLDHNLLGCGFASPSAVQGTAVKYPERYPLYHVVNSDDAVPRLGARMHLGQLLIYPSGEGVRSVCYRWPMTPEDLHRRMIARPILTQMRDTPTCLIALTAFLRLMQQRPVNETAETLGLLQKNAVMKLLLPLVDDRVENMLTSAVQRCHEAYQSIMEQPMPERRVQRMMRMMQAASGEIGLKALLDGLAQLSRYPHSMSRIEGAPMGSYAYIASCGGDKLIPAIWHAGSLPVLEFADGRMPMVNVHVERRVRKIRAVPHRPVPRRRV